MAWQDRFEKISGEKIHCVYGVWDRDADEWFDNAPMLVVLSSGTLSVKVQSVGRLTVGWNDILPTEPPVWLDSRQRQELCNGLDWEENLCWKEYGPAARAFGKLLREIEPIQNVDGLQGVSFWLEPKDCLEIVDVGDAIAGIYVENDEE